MSPYASQSRGDALPSTQTSSLEHAHSDPFFPLPYAQEPVIEPQAQIPSAIPSFPQTLPVTYPVPQAPQIDEYTSQSLFVYDHASAETDGDYEFAPVELPRNYPLLSSTSTCLFPSSPQHSFAERRPTLLAEPRYDTGSKLWYQRYTLGEGSKATGYHNLPSISPVVNIPRGYLQKAHFVPQFYQPPPHAYELPYEIVAWDSEDAISTIVKEETVQLSALAHPANNGFQAHRGYTNSLQLDIEPLCEEHLSSVPHIPTSLPSSVSLLPSPHDHRVIDDQLVWSMVKGGNSILGEVSLEKVDHGWDNESIDSVDTDEDSIDEVQVPPSSPPSHSATSAYTVNPHHTVLQQNTPIVHHFNVPKQTHRADKSTNSDVAYPNRSSTPIISSPAPYDDPSSPQFVPDPSEDANFRVTPWPSNYILPPSTPIPDTVAKQSFTEPPPITPENRGFAILGGRFARLKSSEYVGETELFSEDEFEHLHREVLPSELEELAEQGEREATLNICLGENTREDNQVGCALTEYQAPSFLGTYILTNRPRRGGRLSHLEKVFHIVHCGRFTQWVGWTPKGDAIVIPDQEAFAKNVMPFYFDSNLWDSFKRQLTTYKFQRTSMAVRNGSETIYSHTVSHPALRRNNKAIWKLVAQLPAPSGMLPKTPSLGIVHALPAALKFQTLSDYKDEHKVEGQNEEDDDEDIPLAIKLAQRLNAPPSVNGSHKSTESRPPPRLRLAISEQSLRKRALDQGVPPFRSTQTSSHEEAVGTRTWKRTRSTLNLRAISEVDHKKVIRTGRGKAPMLRPTTSTSSLKGSSNT